MKQKTSLETKKFLHVAYNLGASIVILGALFKILHFKLWFLTGGMMLTIGLLTESIIFVLSALVEDVEEETDWSIVYPELVGGKPEEKHAKAKGILTQKLDDMLKQSNLDATLVQSLSKSISSLKSVVDSINSTVDSFADNRKYSEQMTVAATNLESLNNLYKVQLENTENQALINQAVLKHSEKLEEQMEVLSKNLLSLNSVYGGMLSAMNKQLKVK